VSDLRMVYHEAGRAGTHYLSKHPSLTGIEATGDAHISTCENSSNFASPIELSRNQFKRHKKSTQLWLFR